MYSEYSDRENRGELEYGTSSRERDFRGDTEKKIHGHPLQYSKRGVKLSRESSLERTSHGRHASEKTKWFSHSRHTFEANADSQDRHRSWNTEHQGRLYDRDYTNSIVAGGQVGMDDNHLDKQIMLERDSNATNRRQENLGSARPFNDDDWFSTRSNRLGPASNDRSTLRGCGSSRSETSEGVESVPSTHSLRRQTTRGRSHNKGKDRNRSTSPEHRERRSDPPRDQSSSSLTQKRHRTDDNRSRSRDRDPKRKKTEKAKHKDDCVEKRSILTGKKIKLKVKRDKSDREREANRKELLQFLNAAYE